MIEAVSGNPTFLQLLSQIPAGIAIFRGKQFIINWINEPAVKVFDCEQEDILNKPLEALPHLAGTFLRTLKKTIETGETIELRKLPVGSENKSSARTYNILFKPWLDSANQIDGVIMMATELAEKVEHVSGSTDGEYFKKLADTSRAIIWITEKDGSCSYVSQSWYDVTGQPKTESPNISRYDAVHPGDRIEVETMFAHGNDTHNGFNIIYRLRQADGDYRWINDVATARLDVNGNFQGFVGTIVDIHREMLLKDQLSIALEGSDMGYFDFYPKTGNLIWSKRTFEIYGYDPSGTPSLEYYEKVLHPNDKSRVWSTLNTVLSGGNGGKYFNEYRIISHADKQLKWIRSNGKCFFDDDGKPLRFSGIVQDITKDKEAFQAAQLQSKVLEQMDEGVSISDENGIILFTNAAEDRMFGYEQGELLGKHVTVQNAYDEQENQLIVGAVIDNLKQYGSWKGEWNNRKKDGTSFFTYSFITTMLIDNKTHFVCVQRDITNEKQIKEGLVASEKRFKHIFEGAPVSIWEEDFSAIKDAVVELLERGITAPSEHFKENPSELKKLIDSVVVIDVNTASLTLLEASSKEELKTRLSQIFVEDTSAAFTHELDLIAKGGGRFSYETRMKTLRGKLFDTLVHINFPPLEDSYKSVMVTLTDITSQKRYEEMLEGTVKERTIELQRSNQDLQQFAHVISHDLKEPVRKILTFANRLKTESPQNTGSSYDLYLDKITASGMRMTNMIDSVLAYSMIGSEDDVLETVNLNQLVADIRADLDLLIQEKKVAFTVADLPEHRGKGILMYQVFYNLINNSIKFRRAEEDPHIVITAGQSKDGKMKTITITDNGIGFEPQYSTIIFKAFERLHSKSKYEGTGLGLSLCKKIVERHRGTIEAEGRPGQGATFLISLPA